MNEALVETSKSSTLEKIKVPRKSRANNILNECKTDTKEFKDEVLPILVSSYKLPDSPKDISYSECYSIHSKTLQRSYQKRKIELKSLASSHSGPLPDLRERFAFLSVQDLKDVNEIGEKGIVTGNHKKSRLGSPSAGVSLSQCADLICREEERLSMLTAGWIIICKYIRGRINYVVESNEPLEPTSEYDCHISSAFSTLNTVNLEKTNIYNATYTSQVYLFDFNENFDMIERPRQILPTFAVRYQHSKTRISLLDRHRNKFINSNHRIFSPPSIAPPKSTYHNKTSLLNHPTPNTENEFSATTSQQNDATSELVTLFDSNLSVAEKELRTLLQNVSIKRNPLAHSFRSHLGILRRKTNNDCYVPVGSCLLSVEHFAQYKFSVEIRCFGKQYFDHPFIMQPKLVLTEVLTWDTLNNYLQEVIGVLTSSSSSNTNLNHSKGYASLLIDYKKPKLLHPPEQQAMEQGDNCNIEQEQPSIGNVSSLGKSSMSVQYYRASCTDTANNRALMTSFSSLLLQHNMVGKLDFQVATDAQCFVFPDCPNARSLGIPEASSLEVNYFHMLVISKSDIDLDVQADCDILANELLDYHRQVIFLSQKITRTANASQNKLEPRFACPVSTVALKEFIELQCLMQNKSLFQEVRKSNVQLSYASLASAENSFPQLLPAPAIEPSAAAPEIDPGVVVNTNQIPFLSEETAEPSANAALPEVVLPTVKKPLLPTPPSENSIIRDDAEFSVKSPPFVSPGNAFNMKSFHSNIPQNPLTEVASTSFERSSTVPASHTQEWLEKNVISNVDEQEAELVKQAFLKPPLVNATDQLILEFRNAFNVTPGRPVPLVYYLPRHPPVDERYSKEILDSDLDAQVSLSIISQNQFFEAPTISHVDRHPTIYTPSTSHYNPPPRKYSDYRPDYDRKRSRSPSPYSSVRMHSPVKKQHFYPSYSGDFIPPGVDTRMPRNHYRDRSGRPYSEEMDMLLTNSRSIVDYSDI